MSIPSKPELPAFLKARRGQLPMDLAFSRAGGPYASWATRVRSAWVETLPSFDAPASGDVTGNEVSLRFATGAEAEGRLMLPAGTGPHPAVLLLHEHGGAFAHGWRKMFDDPATTDTLTRLYGGQAPAQVFLEAGFAVLCVDAIGWGGRQCGGYEGQQALAASALGLGWSLAGLVAAEDAQAAAWLATRPEIDPARIGAFGFSFGGFRAWQVAALSSSIAAYASLSWMGCRADLMADEAPLLSGHSAFYMLHPGISARADFADLAGLAAHKAQFYRSGRGDRHMPEASVIAAWKQLERISMAASGPCLDVGFHDAAHTCPPGVLAEAVTFLTTTLR